MRKLLLALMTAIVSGAAFANALTDAALSSARVTAPQVVKAAAKGGRMLMAAAPDSGCKVTLAFTGEKDEEFPLPVTRGTLFEFDFTGDKDVAKFCRIAQEEGLWVVLRPGPYTCAEWEFGGLPWWLMKEDGIRLRTSDPRYLGPACEYLTQIGKTLADNQITRGGNIFLSGGQVIDCAITGGGRHKISMTYDVYGGNVGMTGGRVSRCVISGGIGCTWDSEWGNNVYALGGVVENCLIKDGTDGDAAVYLGGDAKLVNCTVVNNKCYSGAKRKGVYASSPDVRVVDVLVYNNGGGKVSEWAEVNGASFVHCATVANAAITGGEDNITVTAAAFEDVAGGAYRPVKGGALHEAGVSMERYRSFGATSLRDASRKPRLTGSLIDIGCYERYVPAIAVSIR